VFADTEENIWTRTPYTVLSYTSTYCVSFRSVLRVPLSQRRHLYQRRHGVHLRMCEWLRRKHVRTRYECVLGGGTLRERWHVSARGHAGRVCVQGGLRRAKVSGIPGLMSQVCTSACTSNAYSSPSIDVLLS